MKVRLNSLLIFVLLLPIIISSQEKSLNIFFRWNGITDLDNALYHHYSSEAFKLIDKREKEIAQLTTKVDWEKRQQKVKKILQKIVGPFPKKTPLNPHITGVIQKKDYRVEKIIFESQQNFYVTSLMFVPNKLKGKTAAILFPIGHNHRAFRAHHYQKACINFVKKGFIVFTWDPIGQGERIEYLTADSSKPILNGSTMEHSYPGMQCLLNGSSFPKYEIWDGIRAIDYLHTRPEVDTKRLGITGISGGGTLTAYIAALDERIYAAAPECWVTNYRRLFQSWAPQDAEQNLSYELLEGIDHADFLEVRAPKPTLQITTTWDFFPIQGARETEKEVKKIYKAFGAEDNFSRAEDDAKHSITVKNGTTKLAFFQRFLNNPGDSTYEDVEYLTEEELQVTKNGQVLTSLGGETVFSLNKRDATKALNKVYANRKNLKKHFTNILNKAKKLSGYRKPKNIAEVVFTGRYQRDGYAVEKYYMAKGDGNYPIPFLLFVPKEKSISTILYLDDGGKKTQAEVGGEIEMLAKQGYSVLVPDLVGVGELYPAYNRWETLGSNLGVDPGKLWYSPLLIGRSIVGIHAGDIQRLVIFLKQHSEIKTNTIIGVAKGNYASALLHTEAFEKSFSQIHLINPLVSYASVVMNKFYYGDAVPPFVYGALKSYDLPDLVATIAPKKVVMIDIKDQLKNLAKDSEVDKEYGFVKQVYKKVNASDNFVLIKSDKNKSAISLLIEEVKK